MDTVKELLKKLELAEVKADEAGYKYTKDYMNHEKEKAFDDCCKVQFDLYVATAKELAKVTHNNIDFNTAINLIMSKRDELRALLNSN